MLDFNYLVTTLTNTNNILKMYLCYLINTLVHTYSILKVEPYHLANTLTNINDKADNFTKKEV